MDILKVCVVPVFCIIVFSALVYCIVWNERNIKKEKAEAKALLHKQIDELNASPLTYCQVVLSQWVNNAGCWAAVRDRCPFGVFHKRTASVLTAKLDVELVWRLIEKAVSAQTLQKFKADLHVCATTHSCTTLGKSILYYLNEVGTAVAQEHAAQLTSEAYAELECFIQAQPVAYQIARLRNEMETSSKRIASSIQGVQRSVDTTNTLLTLNHLNHH